MARRRVELEPINFVDVLRARRALRIGLSTVGIGVMSRHVSLRWFIVEHRDELRRFAEADRGCARSARELLDAFESGAVDDAHRRAP